MKIMISNSMSKDMHIYVIRDELEDRSYNNGKLSFCPKYIKEHYINDGESQSSSNMDNGVYFESQCIGAGRGGKTLDTLPRKKNGGLSATNIRINKRIDDYHKFITTNGLAVVPNYNTQFPFVSFYDLEFYGDEIVEIFIKGDIDIFPIMYKDELYMIDLKLTEDVDSKFFNFTSLNGGYSCWGEPENLFKNQPLIYHEGVRRLDRKVLYDHLHLQGTPENQKNVRDKYDFLLTDGVIEASKHCNFGFLVFGHGANTKNSKHPSMKFVKYPWTSKRKQLARQLIMSTTNAYMDCVALNWKAIKSDSCSKCKLKCEFRDTYEESEIINE